MYQKVTFCIIRVTNPSDVSRSANKNDMNKGKTELWSTALGQHKKAFGPSNPRLGRDYLSELVKLSVDQSHYRSPLFSSPATSPRRCRRAAAAFFSFFGSLQLFFQVPRV